MHGLLLGFDICIIFYSITVEFSTGQYFYNIVFNIVFNIYIEMVISYILLDLYVNT